ncbi:MAG: fluoride exporter [Thermoleophilaceae bacterium]|jgi:CrcB protein|nr:fluoride exporter [Thermoleophilaceae bacterium]
MTEVLAWTGVALCGAAGSYGRFWVGRALTAACPSDFPYGTFAVNLSGGFLLGLLTGLTVTGDAHLTLGTGLLGAYTTFSTWMFEAQRLGEDGAWTVLWLYLLGSMVAGLATTGLGWLIGGALA